MERTERILMKEYCSQWQARKKGNNKKREIPNELDRLSRTQSPRRRSERAPELATLESTHVRAASTSVVYTLNIDTAGLGGVVLFVADAQTKLARRRRDYLCFFFLL
ncbi:hypothetical protein MRX96_040684 [Rhipicephalus microplus]